MLHSTHWGYYGPVHPAYNPSFSACFFSRNSIFLSQQISQQCFSAGLSAQPNGAYILCLKILCALILVLKHELVLVLALLYMGNLYPLNCNGD
jgi:hypothetical protein